MKKNKHNNTPRLGLDFGKVIMGAMINGQQDTSFLGTTFEQAMQSPATEGAVEAVSLLVEAFEGQVWIVSKCGPTVEKKTRGWLKHNRFYQDTGLAPANLRFCRQRKDKTPICKQLGISHFVDDRIDVLEHMVETVSGLYLFGEQPTKQRTPTWAISVADWDAVIQAIIPINR